MAIRGRRGFTLVELLVVIAIIGILIALLMPAVYAARETARRAKCANNLKQLGAGCIMHLDKHGYFPTGGWGPGFAGMPDQGFGANQPGGWIYNVLPYVEAENLHDLGLPNTGYGISDGSAERIKIALSFLYCPSRREAMPYHLSTTPQGTTTVNSAARNDYVANGGSVDWRGGTCTVPPNGITYEKSQVQSAHVRDGMSNTYMLGEKYLDLNHYTTGLDPGDDESAYGGDWECIIRWGGMVHCGGNLVPSPPMRDEQGNPGVPAYGCFGSSHAAVCQFVFCDGSVHPISYNIDLSTHDRLCRRNDGLPVDTSKY